MDGGEVIVGWLKDGERSAGFPSLSTCGICTFACAVIASLILRDCVGTEDTRSDRPPVFLEVVAPMSSPIWPPGAYVSGRGGDEAGVNVQTVEGIDRGR